MPYFSFSVKETIPSLKKFDITSNNIYLSKNTQLWKILQKQKGSILNFLKPEKRIYIDSIGKNILFCLPPSIGIGDAIEYATAIKKIKEKISFNNIAIAFSGDYSFLFEKFFDLKKNYPFIIKKSEISKFDTVFHITFEIRNLVNQKYFRTNIYEEILNFFNVKDSKRKKILNQQHLKTNKISIFPISSSPIRTMPIKVLNQLIVSLRKNYHLEVFLDSSSEISKYIHKQMKYNDVAIIDPKNKSELVSLIKNIDYGIFMDSGPLHVAKMFNKRGVLLESSVSSKILLKNYNLIKSIENNFSSTFCNAPCGLTDIFNYNNTFGCYDSLKIKNTIFKTNNFKNIINRGVKNHYYTAYKKPVGCLSSLNIQNIYNVIKKDLAL